MPARKNRTMSEKKNIRHLFHSAAFALLLAVACACFNNGFDLELQPMEVRLHLSTSPAFTRADDYDSVPADDFVQGSEDAITRVDLFFFAENEENAAPFYACTVSGLTDKTTSDLTVKVPVDLLGNFPLKQGSTDREGYVYALVNLPAGNTLTETIEKTTSQRSYKVGSTAIATLASLKQLWVDGPGLVSAGIPAAFVMYGGDKVTMTAEGQLGHVTGTIFLERLASKIRLWADIPEHIYVDKTTGMTLTDEEYEEAASKENIETWYSVPKSGEMSNVKLYIRNIATKGRIDGDCSDKSKLGYANIDRNTKPDGMFRYLTEGVKLTAGDGTDAKYTYTHSAAYYSYPNDWDRTLPSEEHQTYLVIEMPWGMGEPKGDGLYEQYQNCYYQIPINALAGSTSDKVDQLDPNKYYRIKIHIGMLGSKDLGNPSDIEASCEVVDWQPVDVNVSIKDRRYLVINQKEWVMNNTESLEIPFSTSHPVELVYCYVNYFRYNDVWGTSSYSGISSHNGDEFKQWVAAAQASTEVNNTEEGVITAVYNNSASYDTLYYKKKYFYDENFAEFRSDKDGYQYYVGHEHPKTFQRNAITYDKNATVSGYQAAWSIYNTKYPDIEAVYTCTIDENKGVIRFNHPLVRWNEYRANTQIAGRNRSVVKYYYPVVNEVNKTELYDEFSRCEVIIKIRHKDKRDDTSGLFEETAYITQYPGMYVEVSHNYGMEYSKTEGGWGNPFVIVNGNNKNSTNPGFEHVMELANHNGSNNNPNMYVIYTTQLSGDYVKYVIGDPRTRYYNNNLIAYKTGSKDSDPGGVLKDAEDNEKEKITSWEGISTPDYYDEKYEYVGGQWVLRDRKFHDYGASIKKAYRIDEGGTDGILKYYYPTDESEKEGSKEQFIAPAFRVASSYGKTYVGSKEEMRRRCASYQEAGRPAGRWRLPTKSEIEYVARLSADGKIPVLFGPTAADQDYGYYWTAQGGVKVNADHSVIFDDEGDGYGWTSHATFAARCVYDEWYWAEINSRLNFSPDPLDTKFRWGDVKKDDAQAPATPLINP